MVNGSTGANTSPTPSPTPTFIDPMDQRNYQAWLDYMNQTHGVVSNDPGYVPGHPETANGSIIFLPTPIPCPTPTPIPSVDPWSRERHRIVDTVQLPPPDYESTEAGILAWDAEHSRGLYPYYSPGDHAVIGLRFVNNYYPKEIKNPEVYLVFKKQVLGQYIDVQSARWIEEGVTIPGAQVDQYEGRLLSALPGFTTTVYEFDVPDTFKQGPWTVDSTGNYILEINVYADNVRACWISKQVTII